MNKIFEKFRKIGIIPVVVLENAKDAEPLGKALMEGGLSCAEITFRTAAAEEAIKIMAEKFPDMLVGAGTVLTVEQVDRAAAAGTCTPSDVEKALTFGLDVVKFFPAEPAGGLNFIKAIAAPYVGVKFMPTGGINSENVKDYLKYDRIIACGGSWMVKGDLIKAGDFEKIRKLTEEAANIVKEIRG